SQISVLNGNIPGLSVTGESHQDNSISQLKSTLYRTINGLDDTKIPIGNYEPGLINKYLLKAQSKTFGTIEEPPKYYSVNTPVEDRIYTYDGPVSAKSIDKNYPTEEQIEQNPSLEVKTNLNALSNN